MFQPSGKTNDVRRLGADVAAADRAQPRYHVLDQVCRRDNLVALALRHSEPEPRQSRIEFRPGHVSLPNFDRPR